MSSPQSQKAQQTRAYFEGLGGDRRCRIPPLPNTPGETFDLLEVELQAALKRAERVGLVGSSLGGFFATALAEKYGVPAVLVNPAVNPHRLMAHFLGENYNPYTGERFRITQRHMQALRSMPPASLNEDLYWVLMQSGDETLDYRDAQSYYSACRMTLEEGGDHSFTTYARYLPDIVKFLKLTEE
ncbi:MAG: putative esterase YcpF (UPF0227 family) [Bermanella sp.]|jgi:predicted esterase YcpF (UPF0227 family)